MLAVPDPAQYAMFIEVINYVCALGKNETGDSAQRNQFVNGMQMIALHERALLARLLNGTGGSEYNRFTRVT
jgi:cysteine desulfurase/selenocysteine lyase